MMCLSTVTKLLLCNTREAKTGTVYEDVKPLVILVVTVSQNNL